ncbi:MAG: ATP-binding protein [Rhodospirillales bacterium]|nr:ATP-binding protein [Rhodospirillales bacterium]
MLKSFGDLIIALEAADMAPEGASKNTVEIERLLLQHGDRADRMTFSVANLTNNVTSEIEGLISETQSDIHTEIVQLGIFSILAILFALLVALYLDTHFSRRVVAMQRAMRSVANNDHLGKIPLAGDDEISDMGRSLQTFVARLGEREERLQELVEKTNKANKDKSRFLAAASHDIRQPIQAIKLFIYALRSNKDLPADQKIIRLLDQSTASLGQILDRLLDLSRLEAGVIHIDKQAFPLSAMFERLADEFVPIANEKRLGLSFVPCSQGVLTDPILLENIMRNLIANAIKNTETGRILIGCRRKEGAEVQLQVWDTGKGIPDDQQSKIFEEFYQLGVNPGNSAIGLGLGLSIVQKIAALLNHELGVVSQHGRGSMFCITVPLDQNPMAKGYDRAALGKSCKVENLSIVVIDDEEMIRKGLFLVLAGNNQVTSAAHVDDLDAKTMQGFPEDAPDIIIADYRLANGKTGVEAISNLCAYYEKDIPAILLTGDTSPERLQKISAHGYSLLHKPVNGDELLLQIQNVLSLVLPEQSEEAYS